MFAVFLSILSPPSDSSVSIFHLVCCFSSGPFLVLILYLLLSLLCAIDCTIEAAHNSPPPNRSLRYTPVKCSSAYRKAINVYVDGITFCQESIFSNQCTNQMIFQTLLPQDVE